MPVVKPYYAVKCNPEPQLIKWLSLSENTGFDCASAREVALVKEVAPAADIIFANPCKKREDILYAMANNVKTTVVDSYEEIDKLAECNWKGDSFIRIRVEDSGSKMPFSAKFGAAATDVESLIEYACVQGQQISGISFHVGSGCSDYSQFRKAIGQANCVIPLTKSLHNTIDIGGGFINNGFEYAANSVARARSLLDDNTQLIAEPGRFFAETSHDLFVKVIGKKPNLHGSGYRYTIDESLYGQFSCIPFDHAQPKWIRIGYGSRRKKPAILYGRTCDSVDMIAAAQEAEELEEGDWLWFPNMGAYTTVTSTEFNGFPKPPLIILENNDSESTLELPTTIPFTQEQWPSGLKYVSAVSVPAI